MVLEQLKLIIVIIPISESLGNNSTAYTPRAIEVTMNIALRFPNWY